MNIEHLINIFGYPAVLLLVMGESMGVPLPGETALLLASAYSGMSGGLSLWGIMAAGSAGAILGDNLGYWLGHRGGRPLLNKVISKFHLKLQLLDKAEGFFEKHGAKTVFFGRFVTFLRVFAALLAGVSKMNYPTFLVYNAAGGIVWACLISLIGHFFGKNLPLLLRRFRELGWILPGLIAIGIIAYFIYKKFYSKKAS
jgi:membrane protein DedA with SNARE-associated domain